MSEEPEFEQTSPENRVGPPYSAITLDTCIYLKFHFNFNNEILHTLKNIGIDFIIDQVIAKEVTKKIRERHKDFIGKYKDLIKFSNSWNLLLIEEHDQLAKSYENITNNLLLQRWNKFIEDQNQQMIGSEYCTIKTLTEAYFNSTPPFQKPSNKNEFPDAIALFSLEAWAKQNDKKILAISSDKAWLEFGEYSNYIDVISDLETGLTQVNIPIQGGGDWISGFISQISPTNNPAVWGVINNFLTKKVKIHPAEVDENGTECSYEVVNGEVDEVEYLENSLSFSNDKDELDISIMGYNPSITTFTVNAHIDIYAQAKFNHFLEDPDGDEYNIGSSTKTATAEKVPVKLLFELKGDINQLDYVPQITDISIIDEIIVPFGEIQPLSWVNEDDLF